MTIKDKNVLIYNYAYEYLISITPKEIVDLEEYFVGDSKDASSLRDVYIELISSAQEYQSLPKVIQFRNRKEEIGHILYDYDYKKVALYNQDDLYYKFRECFNVTSKDSKANLWYRWSCAVVDSAKFINSFEGMDDFRKFVDLFNYNTATRMALPLLISTKIRGVGFALACNFLKELGYLEYPKPDVHIKDVCYELDLSDDDQLSVFESIVKIADDNKVSPYKVDKIFWLICSGNYYKQDINVGRHKEEFISLVKEELLKY